MALRHHTTGNARSWEHRPSDHVSGHRRHWHGPIQPMEQPGFFARLFGRKAR
jgi:hypothetical protein